MNLDTSIQYYDNKKDNVGREISIDKVIQTISGPSLKPFVLTKLYQALQAAASNTESAEYKKLKKAYDDAKGKLPAVTWAGSFTKRSIKNLKQESNLIVLDIDKLSTEDFKLLRSALCNDPFTFLCFTSPSGAGIKVVFKHSGEMTHNQYFLLIEIYFKEKYSIELDKSGKDISRLCFLCHDADLYINEKALDFTSQPIQTKIPQADQQKAAKLTKPQQTALTDTGEDLYSVIAFTDKLKSYGEGSRNNYIHLFACNANRKGFSLIETLSFAVLHFSDMQQSEVETTVKSAYTHNSHEHAKFKKQIKSNTAVPASNRNAGANKTVSKVPQSLPATTGAPLAGSNATQNSGTMQADTYNEEPIQFWKERKIKKKGEDGPYEIKSYELLRVEFTDFLYQQGFHLLENDAGGYQMCFSRDGIIAPVEPRHIKKFVFQWCKNNVEREIEEMLRKGQKQFFASNEMDALHTKKVELKIDTEHESYYYFNNCWVTVTADGVTGRPYSELDKLIWAGTKKTHNLTIKEPVILTADEKLDPAKMDCEFAKFVYFVSYNPNSPDEKDFDKETIDQRFCAIASAIGFMLDGYKHPADRKAIFAVDHKIGEMGEQNGRTGKSIIPKAIEKLKVVANIAGKNFDPKYQFRYEPITMDSQVINFNDMPRTFDVESIFELIADDYSVNRRNNGFIHHRYDTSPKLWVSTNFTPKGAGDSYSARMHIVEFSDYFNAKHSPYDEFGHGMFSSAWDDEEWNRFYNFLLWCVQMFKKDGLVPYPHSNFDARKLANEVNAEFIDFMTSRLQTFIADGNVEVKSILNQRIKKIDLLEEFNKIYQQLYSQKLKPHTFHKWVKQFCKHEGLHFNPHKQGGYDKSNGTEFYTIAMAADFKPVETPVSDLFNNNLPTPK